MESIIIIIIIISSSLNHPESGFNQMRPTFEEDKFPVVPLVGGVDVGGQALPEVTDGHRVTRQHLVVTHTPKPLVLQTHTHARIDYT